MPRLDRLPDILRTALRVAVSGVPGPVHVDIPAELTLLSREALTDFEPFADGSCAQSPAFRLPPAPADIARVLDVIRQARRPLLLAGGGVIAAEAWGELVRFSELLAIPVVTSAAGKASIPGAHPLAVGVTGSYSRKVANDVVHDCDTYVVIGSDLGDMTTAGGRLPGQARIVHIDADPGVLGLNAREDVSVVADARLALEALIAGAEASGLAGTPCPWTEWLGAVQARVRAWKAAFRELASRGGAEGSVNPYAVMAALNEVIGPDDVIVADTGDPGAFAAALGDVKTAGRTYVRAAGSLGWAFPAALGVQGALDGRGRTFCVIGDGGFASHAAEVETAVRPGLPVVVVVMNNGTLAFESHLQKFMYRDVMPETFDFRDLDYCAVARAFGAAGEKVRRPGDVEGALRRARGGDSVVDAAIDRDVYAPVVHFESVEERRV